MLHKLLSWGIATGVALAGAGCATMNDPNAVVTIDGERTKVLVTQADKRAIFTFDSKLSAYACPEPSPDVKADVDAALKALLDVSAKLPDGTSATARTELDSTRKLITAALLQRSQGLQVLRDMLFQSCLANLRGDMSAQQYNSFVTVTLPRLTTSLIAMEMVTKQDQGRPALDHASLQVFLNFVLLNQ